MNMELSTWLQTAPASVQQVILALSRACTKISEAAADGALREVFAPEGTQNSQGEVQSKLDVFSHNEVVAALTPCASVAGWASEELEEPEASPTHACSGELLVVFDPLDGSSNIESNISYGTIFSLLPHPFRGTEPHAAAFLQPGDRQVAAGYVVYGPSTLLVLCTGREVCQFTLERSTGRWLLTRANITIPERTREFAINVSNIRFWEPPVQRYVSECLSGETGPRRVTFNMRWVASLVADVHRIITRGGVYLYPRDEKEPRKPGRLRLLYEAAPMAFLMEHAGAAASTGTHRLLETQPESLHQRAPMVIGSREEVERIIAYHEDPNENVSMQLFRNRSLFVPARA